MSGYDVETCLRGLERMISSFLQPSSREVLLDAVRQVEDSHKRHTEWKGRTHHLGAGQGDWGFRILPARPLQFRRADHIEGLRPEVDLYGTMRWTSDDSRPDEACFVLRVWTSSDAYFHRERWDGEETLSAITAPQSELGVAQHRRVMLRLHFDLKASDARTTEPLYHLHVGGQAQDDERCWFPNAIDNPRIPYVPVDLVLACQIIVADFFEEEYAELARRPEWEALLSQSQATMLKPYFEECLCAMNAKSWLGHLHNADYRRDGR